MGVAALMVAMGHGTSSSAAGVLPAVVAAIFTAITGALLIGDLKQPGRFLYILTKSNTSSWLVRGAWILGAFAGLTGLWGLVDLINAEGALPWLALPMVALGAAVAGYTAFLFGQCEGRDLWQTPLLLPTLLAQAAVAGSSAYALLDLVIDVPEQDAIVIVMLIGLGTLGGLIATELWSHPSRSVELAVLEMTKGAYAGRFWFGGVLAGIVLPLVLAAIALASSGDATTALAAFAGLSALIGLFSYEDAYVRAGQSVPLS